MRTATQQDVARGALLHRKSLHRRPQTAARRSRVLAPPRASAAAAGGEDPYQVLGVARGADSKRVQQAYHAKVKELRGDKAGLERVEAAHTRLMMAAFSARAQGGADKSVAYADKAVYFPWRPRFWRADDKVLRGAGVAQGLLLAWALLLRVSAATQPLVYSAVASAFANAYKQYQLHPVASAESDSEKRQGLKNIARGCILAGASTFLGCFVFFTVPDFIASTLSFPLPALFFESEATILNVGAVLFNYLTTAFFR